MTITKSQNGTSFVLAVEGRLDTATAPELEKEIQSLTEAAELIIDFSKLDYISSAGLRVLLSAHKNFARKSGLTIINVSETVLEVFDVTGFRDILNIK
ncbi:STAS domain-containing protein [Treponema sp.]|uniref:STAS domain-containing protein n=1 Tax=Treponema sp. TaxID=166 RepID=UPI00388F1C83